MSRPTGAIKIAEQSRNPPTPAFMVATATHRCIYKALPVAGRKATAGPGFLGTPAFRAYAIPLGGGRVTLYLVCAGDGMPIMWCLANLKIGEREVLAGLLGHNHDLIRRGPDPAGR